MKIQTRTPLLAATPVCVTARRVLEDQVVPALHHLSAALPYTAKLRRSPVSLLHPVFLMWVPLLLEQCLG